MIPELLSIVGNTNLAYNEIGLIENVEEEIYKPRDENDVLVSRKRDGSIARISHHWIVQKLSQLECDGLCVLLCTGEFDSDHFILPCKVVDSFFSAMPKLNHATVIVPEKEQCSNALKRWAKIAKRVNCISFSPYRESTLSVDLSHEQLVYLDCMGFTLKHEELLKRQTKGFVVSARRILANYLRNLLT